MKVSTGNAPQTCFPTRSATVQLLAVCLLRRADVVCSLNAHVSVYTARVAEQRSYQATAL